MIPGLVKEYSPSRTQIVFNGVLLFGFADELIRIAYDEDAFNAESGAQGEVVRTRNLNEMGTVTTTLQAMSNCNDLLSAIHTTDKLSGAGKGPLLVKYDGLLVAQSTWAWIKKMPELGYAREHGSREWVFGCAQLNAFARGSIR